MMELFATSENFSFSEALAQDAIVLRNFCSGDSAQLLLEIQNISTISPWRHMNTPGGRAMSVAMTNCGPFGWVSDSRGYRYQSTDPMTSAAWPSLPKSFKDLARNAAEKAGYENFVPDACLINRYAPAAKMTLHQDRDELDMSQPIVSVSLGVSATFLFGGMERNSPTAKVLIGHGDVVVWGGASRLFFHGIKPLKQDFHPLTGEYRYNLTFRKAK